MRFLTDQDVYQVTVELLRKLDHDVQRASDVGLAQTSDVEILHAATQQRRILITRDKGFGSLVFLQHREHSGVILLRMTPSIASSVHRELERVLRVHPETELQSCFTVVEPGRHRVRHSLRPVESITPEEGDTP